MRAVTFLAAVLAALVVPSAVAQQPQSDTLPATDGNITITPLMHATVQIAHGPHIIAIDPTSQASREGLPKPTLILLTDVHPDHLDPKAIEAIRTPATKIVAPAAVQIEGAMTLANGETKTVDGVTIEAVPMYNLERGPKPGALFHTKGRGNGYVLTLGGKRLYVAGDTECTPEMKALKNIDVAFVPMNLPYTMPPAEAAECVKAFKPKIVYPYHYRGQDPQAFEAALAGTGIEVRRRDWYPGAPAAK